MLEPRVGGYRYDRGTDGSECRWARVLACGPPHRLLFSWNISPHWQIEADPAKTSEWEVHFIAETPERTRVELEHRNLDRHGEGWEGVREGIGGNEGWPLCLQRYANLMAGKVRAHMVDYARLYSTAWIKRYGTSAIWSGSRTG
ncbi:MAG: SRPBCC domain-containing protein [Streptosporangiaceae bacterium]|nr:SRPBCC domain-containing protein [Streptosporangiaceae bacterium]MBV9857309.1 SRPBCC domain-containing protein [Streptosporangiaceae bacterium]